MRGDGGHRARCAFHAWLRDALRCASGREGLVHLTPADVRPAYRSAGRLAISNVLMGSGEPLDNLTMCSLCALQADFGIGIRHISLSTRGLVSHQSWRTLVCR